MAESDRDKLVSEWFETSGNLHRAWRLRFQAEMGVQPLSMGQLGLLFYVHDNQPVSSKQIAADTHNSKSAVAQLLEGLDDAGLVIRRHDDKDRRVVHVSLSADGVARVRSLQDRRRAFFMELASELSDQEIAGVLHAQQKMLCKLEQRQER